MGDAAPAEPDGIDLGPIQDSLGVALRLAQIYLFDRFYADLHDVGLKPGEFTVLAAIGRNPGIRQGVLAGALAIKRSNMAKLVTALNRRQLVERRVPPADRRAVELSLTDAGRAFVAAMSPRVTQHDLSASAGTLTPVERATLIRLLRKLPAAGAAIQRRHQQW